MAHPQPPNLEVISNPKLDQLERRRVPRIALTGEQFRLDTAGTVFSVTDLSEDGMALRIINPEHQSFFVLGSILQGHLNLRGNKFSVQVMIRYVSGESIGCQFEAPSAELSQTLKKVLDPESLGAELKAMPSSENGPSWYHGPSGTDLLFWRKPDGAIKRICVFILGSFIQWEAETGISTGKTLSSPERTESFGAVHFDTLLLQPDAKTDALKLQIARALIGSSSLAPDLKQSMVHQLVLGQRTN